MKRVRGKDEVNFLFFTSFSLEEENNKHIWSSYENKMYKEYYDTKNICKINSH